MKITQFALAAAILGLSLPAVTSLPALAQNMPPAAPAMAGPPVYDTVCGTVTQGVWTPNGYCPGYNYRQAGNVSGTIVAVRGHLVTIQQSTKTIVINDSPALRNQASGRVAVGRMVKAHGYWNGGTFYATVIE